MQAVLTSQSCLTPRRPSQNRWIVVNHNTFSLLPSGFSISISHHIYDDDGHHHHLGSRFSADFRMCRLSAEYDTNEVETFMHDGMAWGTVPYSNNTGSDQVLPSVIPKVIQSLATPHSHIHPFFERHLNSYVDIAFHALELAHRFGHRFWNTCSMVITRYKSTEEFHSTR